MVEQFYMFVASRWGTVLLLAGCAVLCLLAMAEPQSRVPRRVIVVVLVLDVVVLLINLLGALV